MAKMLKTDLHIVLSSEQGYVAGYNILIKEGGEGPPILLGHYHESHYQSLDSRFYFKMLFSDITNDIYLYFCINRLCIQLCLCRCYNTFLVTVLPVAIFIKILQVGRYG